MGFSIYDVTSLYLETGQYDDASPPNSKTVILAPQLQTKALLSILASNTGTTDVVLTVSQIYETTPGILPLVAVTIPAGAGNGIIPAVDMLAGLAPNPAGVILAPPPWGFQISNNVAPSTGAVVYWTAIVGIF